LIQWQSLFQKACTNTSESLMLEDATRNDHSRRMWQERKRRVGEKSSSWLEGSAELGPPRSSTFRLAGYLHSRIWNMSSATLDSHRACWGARRRDRHFSHRRAASPPLLLRGRVGRSADGQCQVRSTFGLSLRVLGCIGPLEPFFGSDSALTLRSLLFRFCSFGKFEVCTQSAIHPRLHVLTRLFCRLSSRGRRFAVVLFPPPLRRFTDTLPSLPTRTF